MGQALPEAVRHKNLDAHRRRHAQPSAEAARRRVITRSDIYLETHRFPSTAASYAERWDNARPMAYAIVAAGVSEEFVARVERAAKEYFEEILPRFIDRHFRGRGYELVARMLQVHDLGTLRQPGPPPSERARHLAKGGLAQAPLVVSAERRANEQGPVLGEFLRHETVTPLGYAQRDIVQVEYTVLVYEGSLRETVPPEKLDDEILLTIFHEYIHYVESFLPERHRPLMQRERGVVAPPPSIEGARWRDRIHAARFWGIGAAIVSVAVLFALMSLPPGMFASARPTEPAPPASPTPPRDYEAEAQAFQEEVALAVFTLEADEALKAIERVANGGIVDREAFGLLTYMQLEPLPGEGPLPEIGRGGLACWLLPRAEMFPAHVVCALWLEDRRTVFRAQMRATSP